LIKGKNGLWSWLGSHALPSVLVAAMTLGIVACSNPVASGPVAVTGIQLDVNNLSLFPEAGHRFVPTFTPLGATNRGITWASDNASIATVSADGIVKAIAVGSATITATTTDGAKVASCSITVPNDSYGVDFGIAFTPAGHMLLAGRVGASSSDCTPCYWDNGTLVRLPLGDGNAFGKASRVAVDATRGDVYINGWVGATSAATVPVYWKNGTLYSLPMGTGNAEFSFGQTLVDASGNYYIAGAVGASSNNVDWRPCYWQKGVLNFLPLGNSRTYGQAYGMALDPQGGLAFSGWTGGGSYGYPGYWRSGNPQVDIQLSVGDTYYNNFGMAFDNTGAMIIVGDSGSSNTTKTPAYWKNGAETKLDNSGYAQGQTLDIAVDSADDVYITGWSGIDEPSALGVYWKNGTRVPVDFGSYVGASSGVYLVTVNGGHVYLTGDVGDSTGHFYPALWTDGILTTLSY